jgi:peptide/nickel transport system substrate-binding protein
VNNRCSIRRAGLALLGSALVLASCGGDDDDSGETSPAATEASGTAATAASGATSSSPGSAAASESESTDAGAEPKTGGTATYVFSGAVRSLDPITIRFLGANNDSAQALPVYDVLLYQDATTGEIHPRIAESLESDDSINWTLKLRPDVMFSDGTPLDAAAVQYNWERAKDESSELLTLASTIVAMNPVDATTLEVELDGPNGQFPVAVATSLSLIGSPTAIEEKGEAYGDAPVGAGPFVLDELVRGSRITYSKNPDYWDSPRPFLDGIVMLEVADAQQVVNTVSTDAADAAEAQSPQAIALGDTDGFELIQTVHNGGTLIGFNMTKPPFDDVRLRQAWSMAVDPDALAETAGQGIMIPMSTLFTEGGAFPPGPDLYPYDPEGAKALVDEYAAEHGGGPVRVTLGTFQTANPLQYEYMQAQLKDVGIEVAIEPADSTAAGQKVFTKNYEAHYWGTPFVDPDPTLIQYFGTESSQNFWGWDNERANEALLAARASQDLDERTAQYDIFLEELQADVPVFYYARYVTNQLLHDYVKGFVLATDAPMWHEVWLDN